MTFVRFLPDLPLHTEHIPHSPPTLGSLAPPPPPPAGSDPFTSPLNLAANPPQNTYTRSYKTHSAVSHTMLTKVRHWIVPFHAHVHGQQPLELRHASWRDRSACRQPTTAVSVSHPRSVVRSCLNGTFFFLILSVPYLSCVPHRNTAQKIGA